MAMKGKTTTDPLIIVSLTDGLANRNRLPLSHVIKVLKEVESMINDLGIRLLKERGVEDVKPDFGIEIVAEEGIAFQKGSVRATIAITRYVDVGMLAAGELIGTTSALSIRRSGLAVERDYATGLSARVVSGLDKIAYINQAAHTKASFEVKAPRSMIHAAKMTAIATRRATLGDIAAENLRSLRVPAFEETNVRLYGKLYRLKDKPVSDTSLKTFWGELHRDNGEQWRIEFKGADLGKVVPLFTHQVLITGTAYYFGSASPKLNAEEFELDEARDLVAAYSEFYGVDMADAIPPDLRPT